MAAVVVRLVTRANGAAELAARSGPETAGEAGPGVAGTDETRAELDRLTAELARLAPRLPERLEAGPDDAERGLAQLVLTLVEFVRQLLEKQAVRRMEGGSLSEDEIERLGLTLLRLRDRMEELRNAFGLEAEDLMLRLDSTSGPG